MNEKFVRYALQASKMGVAKKDQRGIHAPKIIRWVKRNKKVFKITSVYFQRLRAITSRRRTRKSLLLTYPALINWPSLKCTNFIVKCVLPMEPGHSLIKCIEENSKAWISLFTSQRKTSAKHALDLITKYPQNTKNEHDRHIQQKNQAYRLEEKIKQHTEKNPETIATTFDLEAVLYTPFTKVSTLLYMRKLCPYNLTMFNPANKEDIVFFGTNSC